MIYLICAKDSKQRFVELREKDGYEDNLFYKFFVDNFEHKNILYSLDFYKKVTNEILPQRVNVIYTHLPSRKLPNIVNAIVSNNIKDIIKSYKNDIDDVYVFATDTWLVEEFGKIADYLIIFSCDELDSTPQQLSDLLDYSNYNLIRLDNPEKTKYRVEYHVSNKTGK